MRKNEQQFETIDLAFFCDTEVEGEIPPHVQKSLQAIQRETGLQIKAVYIGECEFNIYPKPCDTEPQTEPSRTIEAIPNSHNLTTVIAKFTDNKGFTVVEGKVQARELLNKCADENFPGLLVFGSSQLETEPPAGAVNVQRFEDEAGNTTFYNVEVLAGEFTYQGEHLGEGEHTVTPNGEIRSEIPHRCSDAGAVTHSSLPPDSTIIVVIGGFVAVRTIVKAVSKLDKK